MEQIRQHRKRKQNHNTMNRKSRISQTSMNSIYNTSLARLYARIGACDEGKFERDFPLHSSGRARSMKNRGKTQSFSTTSRNFSLQNSSSHVWHRESTASSIDRKDSINRQRSTELIRHTHQIKLFARNPLNVFWICVKYCVCDYFAIFYSFHFWLSPVPSSITRTMFWYRKMLLTFVNNSSQWVNSTQNICHFSFTKIFNSSLLQATFKIHERTKEKRTSRDEIWKRTHISSLCLLSVSRSLRRSKQLLRRMLCATLYNVRVENWERCDGSHFVWKIVHFIFM